MICIYTHWLVYTFTLFCSVSWEILEQWALLETKFWLLILLCKKRNHSLWEECLILGLVKKYKNETGVFYIPRKYAAAAKLLQSCPTLWDPIDSSPQAPPSLGFSRQEHWSGLPFPSPMHESENWKWSCSVMLDS